MVKVTFEGFKQIRDLGKSDRLEQLGYKMINQNNKYHYLFINDLTKKGIVLILGLESEYDNLVLELINPANIFKFDENNSRFLKIINYIIMRINEGSSFINNIKQNYTEYEITFFGNSIGGLIINKNLQNTKFKCYTYNPAFIYENVNSENIINYRTSGDIVSLPYIFFKNTQIIEVTFIEYLLKNDLIKTNLNEFFNINNFINYVIDSHFLGFLDDYKTKIPVIDIS